MILAVATGFYIAGHVDNSTTGGQLAAMLALGLGFVASYGLYQHFAAMDREELDRRITLENAQKRQDEKRKTPDQDG